MLALSPLDISDSGEKALNLSADYEERKNLEIKIDNQNFVSGILEKLPNAFSAVLKNISSAGSLTRRLPQKTAFP